MELSTKRLVIRDYKKLDLKSLEKNINDLDISRNLLVVPYPYTKKDAEWWISHCKEEMQKSPRSKYSFAIELKSERMLVGGIGLDKVDLYQGTAEVGYWLGKKYWRQGLMSEALGQVVQFAFEELKLRRIDLNAFVENTASNELAKKFGFVYEGTGRQKVRAKADGAVHDENYYGLLKQDWEKQRDED
jgi:[ribosomal protein S5]-alanine N-acetyltransferase